MFMVALNFSSSKLAEFSHPFIFMVSYSSDEKSLNLSRDAGTQERDNSFVASWLL